MIVDRNGDLKNVWWLLLSTVEEVLKALEANKAIVAPTAAQSPLSIS
jgi:hypothetical protein